DNRLVAHRVHFALTSCFDACFVNILKLRCARWKAKYTNFYEIAFYPVVRDPLLDKRLIRKARSSTIYATMIPARVLISEADAVKLSRVTNRLPPSKKHWLAIG